MFRSFRFASRSITVLLSPVTTASSLLSSWSSYPSLEICCVAQMVEMIQFSEETKVCSGQMRWWTGADSGTQGTHLEGHRHHERSRSLWLPAIDPLLGYECSKTPNRGEAYWGRLHAKRTKTSTHQVPSPLLLLWTMS